MESRVVRYPLFLLFLLAVGASLSSMAATFYGSLDEQVWENWEEKWESAAELVRDWRYVATTCTGTFLADRLRRTYVNGVLLSLPTENKQRAAGCGSAPWQATRTAPQGSCGAAILQRLAPDLPRHRATKPV